ncbi:MAG: FAD-binding oxidoreductase [Gemmatimonadota bacterium]
MTWILPSSAAELAERLVEAEGAGPRSAAERARGPVAVTGRPARAVPPDVDETLAAEGTRVISTARLAEVVDYEPRDLVITVGAGMRLSRLRKILAAEGQWLPPAEGWTGPGGPTDGIPGGDGPPGGSGGAGGAEPGSAGGLAAAARPTAFDLRYGRTCRHVLACRLVSPHGREFRWGRPVMKNVAGYDLHGLCCGSHGRLGTLVEVSFRLWPCPRERITYGLEGNDGLALAGQLATGTAEEELSPETLTWRRVLGTGGGALHLTLAGSPESVRARQERLEVWAAKRRVEIRSSRDEGQGSGAEGGGTVAKQRPRSLSSVVLRCTVQPSGWARLARRLAATLDEHPGLLEGYPLLGVLRCGYRRPADPAASATLLERLLAAAVEASVAVERGGPREHALAEERRVPEVRALEEKVIRALGGGPRGWIADYV